MNNNLRNRPRNPSKTDTRTEATTKELEIRTQITGGNINDLPGSNHVGNRRPYTRDRGFNVDIFKGEVNRRMGFAEPNKFRMIMSGGILRSAKIRSLSFLINQAAIPSKSFGTNDIRTHGPIRKAPYVTIYDDLQISAFCTNDGLFPRNLFEEWQAAIIHPWTGKVNYFNNYVCDLVLEQYDNDQNLIYKCKFIDAYPVMVAPLELNWAATNTIHNLNVTFAYRKWYMIPPPETQQQHNVTIDAEWAVATGDPLGDQTQSAYGLIDYLAGQVNSIA